MKKFLQKQIAIIILLMLILSIVAPTMSCAASTINQFAVSKKSEAFKRWESLSAEERKDAIEPTYFATDFKASIKRSTYNQQLKSGSSLGDKFNLKNVLSNINVKDQKGTGSCWAFSYSSLIETTLANKYNLQSRVYSPMHIDYMASKMFNKTVGDGGNPMMALSYGASGLGPVYEQDLPFDSVYDEINNPPKYYLKNISEVDLNQVSRARIEEVKNFAGIFKTYSTNSIKYTALDGVTEYSIEEVNALRNVIKKHIKEYGAVEALFYSDMGTLSTGETISEEGFWNAEKNAYYCNDSTKEPNHAVTIVGWDDTYDNDNFATNKQPLNDGAYIVLNSWGTGFGDGGYYYVSYDDAMIELSNYGITEITEKENIEDKFYDNIYEYDELGISQELGWGEEITSLYAANAFNRIDTNEKEYLTEVGVFLGRTQGVEVYVNTTDGNIDNCTTLVASYTGTNALEPGYHTLKLASPVELSGTKFVVKVKYINSEGASIPFECDLKESGFTYESTYYDTATSNQGESFISLDGTDWYDIYNLKVGYTQTLMDTNVCIKAFTTLSKTPTPVAVTGVTLDKETVTIKEGETATLKATVLPENATNKNVTWSSSNENIATVANGVVTGIAEGTTTITVKTQDGSFEDTCEVTVEKVQLEPIPVAVTGVTLDKETVTIKEGETATLKATVLPENATNKNVTWSSSNENIATVANGVVTGIAEGTTTITVKTQDGSFEDICQVIVEKNVSIIKVSGVKLDKTSLDMQVGEKINLVATIQPLDATEKDVIWSSSNEQVAKISENGIIEALKEGTTTITVKTKDGSFTATCEITVVTKTNSDDDIYTENEKQPGKIEQAGDSTTAKGEIPNAGAKTIITVVVMSIIIAICIYKKYKTFNDIK